MTGIDCFIDIKAKQIIRGEEDHTDDSYEGKYFCRLEKNYLSYKRKEDDEEVSVLITFDEVTLTISQQGTINSRMTFNAAERTYNHYGTSVGTMMITVDTKEYRVTRTGDQIQIDLKYDILTGCEVAVTNDMCIKVKMEEL